MPQTPVVAQIGGLSQTGLAIESVSGTFTTPTALLPFSESTIDPNPGLFYPPAVIGYRDTNVWPLYGQYKFTGALAGALFPTNCGPIFSASIGSDNQAGYGITGSTPADTTYLTANVAIGATSISVNLDTGFVVGSVLQIDTNAPSATPITTSECRKIVSITGSGPYAITIDEALDFAHVSGAPVNEVVAPYTHTCIPTASLPTLSVQSRIGDTQAQEWAGVAVNKFSLKGQATNTAIDFTADVIAKTYAINDSPAFINVIDESPLEWVGLTTTYNNLTVSQANNLTFDLDNGVVEDYTFNQQHTVEFLTPAKLIANGTFDVIYNSLDDPEWGFFSQILSNQISTGLSFNFTGPNGSAFEVIMDKVNLSTYKDAVKEGETIKTTLGFEAALSLSDTPVRTLKVLVTDSRYLPF